DQKALEEYTGFTEDEVKALCDRFQMNFDETSSWYDGYSFTRFQHIFNPRSVVEAMCNRRFSNYWVSTEVYDALKIYMDMDFDGLREEIVQMLGGGRVRVNTRSFRNDMRNLDSKDDVLTLLIHLGYLACDSERKEAFIPNKEIIEEFENAMSTGGWPEVMHVLKASERLVEDTLACAIGLAYYSARKDYRLIRELPTGRGFADIVFLPLPHTGKPALIVELKYDKSARTAIRQIKDRQYIQALEDYMGEILLVGIGYDKDNADKPHSCVIERWESQACADTCR
ncbi:MAG: ATP-binding protein, partial [Lachnospiraceae bacterium]|nr:ATP-binding protein [Lachnospiraceae bacterium]